MSKDLICEITINISPQSIVGTISPGNSIVNFRNIAVVDRRSNYMLAVGKTFDQYKKETSMEEGVILDFDTIDTIPAFDDHIFSPEASANIALSLIASLKGKLSTAASQKIDVFINFPNYENINLSLRNDFEFLVSKFARVGSLSINGRKSQNDHGKILFLQLTYLISFLLGPVFVTLCSPLMQNLIRNLGLDELSTIFDLFICTFVVFVPIIIFAAAGLFIAELLWMLLMRSFFPKQMLRNTILYFYNTSKRKISPLSLLSHKLLLMDKK